MAGSLREWTDLCKYQAGPYMSDSAWLDEMFRHESIPMPSQTAGSHISQAQHNNEVAIFPWRENGARSSKTSFHVEKKRGSQKAFLTRNVDLDRIFIELLNVSCQQWFLRPRMPPQGYKDQPWRHLMPYDIIFESNFTKLDTDEVFEETFRLGITDDFRLTGYAEISSMLYLEGPEGKEELTQQVMSLLLLQLDEALIHPLSFYSLHYPDGSTRVWGRGSGNHADVLLLPDFGCALETDLEVKSKEIYKALQRFGEKREPATSEIRRSLENAYRLIEIRKDLFAKRLIAKAAEDAVCCQAALQAPQEGIVDLTNSINQEPGSEEICTLTVPCGDQYWSPTSSGGSLPESWKGTAEEDDEDEKGSAAGQSADHIPGRISISRLPPTGMESPPTGMEPPTPTYSPDFEPREEGRPQIKSSASSTAADFRLRLHELESLQKLEKLLRLLVMQQLARHR